MPSAADNLVKEHPTRIKQLLGPVVKYFKYKTAKMPLNGTEQDLYMTVFMPTHRRVSMDTVFSARVRKDNPNINKVSDYVNKVNAKPVKVKLTPDEEKALRQAAAEINAPVEGLRKLINFESGWNPTARNPISGARGLIQFMPFVAREMGYKDTIGITTIAMIGLVGWFLGKKYHFIG